MQETDMNNTFVREILYKNYKITAENVARASKYVELTGDDEQDFFIIQALENVRLLALKGVKSDNLKHIIPESYLTDLVMTINVRSLRNFLQLRLSKSAHKSIRALANEMLTSIPVEHLFLYKDLLEENKND
ncbi:FAD-dependent thymidylate synthase [Campylobacter concisus]|uniref:Uncharacterized protein n=1 Tax=Campylobacter concisus TaxID=199 RepID=A0A1Y5MHJ2_9BACT|nr:FAD-dependent thymidylate synthase [Campylobacter concisus]OUT06864.1 hypothetical protein B9N65_09800 [Campylobacter concisus]OUT08972.1 hypothetical protein B9N65_01125 [Campylobacter concisus]